MDVEFIARRAIAERRREYLVQPFGQALRGVVIVEADIKSCHRRCRDDIRGRVANIDGRYLQGRRLKLVRAVVQRIGGQGLQHIQQPMHGVVRQMGVGGVALDTVHGHRSDQTSAPSDFNHVAQFGGVGRLADHASVDGFVARGKPVENLAGSVDCWAFFVAANQQTDRPRMRPVRRVAVGGSKAGDCANKGCDGAFHVGRAAAEQRPVDNVTRKRIVVPIFGGAGRHHIGVPGEAKIGRAGSEPRIEVGHVVGARFGKCHDVAFEADRVEGRAQYIQCAGVDRRDAGTPDQSLGQRNWFDGGRLWLGCHGVGGQACMVIRATVR